MQGVICRNRPVILYLQAVGCTKKEKKVFQSISREEGFAAAVVTMQVKHYTSNAFSSVINKKAEKLSSKIT